MAKTEKSYKNRFGNFRAGVCPYCGAREAELIPKRNGRYVGKCTTGCKAINNFTNPLCKEWYDQL